MLLHSYDKNGILLAHRTDDTPDPDYYILHAHDVCELYYFICGSGYYTVEGTNYPLFPGAMLLMRDGEAHTLHIDADKRYERITVNFMYEQVDPDGSWDELHSLVYDRKLGEGNMIGQSDSSEYMSDLLSRLCSASEREGKSADNEINRLFGAVMAEAVRLSWNREMKMLPDNEEGYSEKNVNRAEAKIVVEIINYINAHLFEIENLAQIEAGLYFSRSYINRIFKAATGSSVWNYVLFKRLVAAQRMLKCGIPASVAASRCGFKDYSSFYKQYKSRIGVAPTAEKTGIVFR